MKRFWLQNWEWICGLATILGVLVLGHFFHGTPITDAELAEIKARIAARHEEEYRARCAEYGVTPDNLQAWAKCRAKAAEEVELEEFEAREEEDHRNGY